MNKKITLIVVGILLVLSLAIGMSYAYYMIRVDQDGTNLAGTACFKISYEDKNDINLLSALPISDSAAMELEPYTFTIKNICNQKMDFYVNIEVLNDTTMDLNAVKYVLDNSDPKILGSINDNDSSVYVNDNVVSSKMIRTGILNVNQEKTFNLRMYIDENSTVEQAAEKAFYSKVTINTVNRKENASTLISGPEFNSKIKKLVGIDEELNDSYYFDEPKWVRQELDELDTEKENEYEKLSDEEKYEFDDYYNKLNDYYEFVSNYNYDTEFYDNKIKNIIFTTNAPDNDKNTISVSTDNSINEILAWFDDGKLYVYSKSDTILLNRDSSYLFSGLIGLENIEHNGILDTSEVVNMSHVFDLSQNDIEEEIENYYYSTYLGQSSEDDFDDFNIERNDFNDTTTIRTFVIRDYYSGSDKVRESPSAIDVSFFDTYNVEDMSDLFRGRVNVENIDLSHFDTSNVENMSRMFSGMENLNSLDLSNFDTSNVTDMSHMFDSLTKLPIIDLSSFNTSKVTNMSGMFTNMENLNSLDLSHFDTSNVTDMSYMFNMLENISTIDLSSINTSKVTNMSGMFAISKNIINLDLSNFDTSNVENMSGIFCGMWSLTSLDLSHFDTSNVTDMSNMFEEVSSLTSLDVSHFNTSKVTDMAYMFKGMSDLTSLDVSQFDTSKLTDMSGMFRDLSKLTSLDLSNFDTSNVVNMGRLFLGMKNLTTLNISSFNTTRVKNMCFMFGDLNKIQSLDLSHFDTSNVKSMSFMFSGLKNISDLDLSSFNTSNVLSMKGMFSQLEKMDTIDISNFDTSNVVSMGYMFTQSNFKTLDLRNFNTSKVINMAGMFSYCNNLTELDLSSFDTSNVVVLNASKLSSPGGYYVSYYSGMFSNMDNIKTIIVGDTFDMSKVKDSKDIMFKDSSKLVGGAGTTYDANHVGKEYARIDDPTNDKPGYFTLKTT